MNSVEKLGTKNLVNHIANGRLGELCLLCLVPLGEISFENIFTLICKEETEYCVAEALAAVCQFEFHRSDNYNVCVKCFKSASEAYKFQLRAKRSMELITHYTQQLLNDINSIEVTSDDMEKLLFVPLSEYNPETRLFDFNLEGIGRTAIITGESTDSIAIVNDIEYNSIHYGNYMKHHMAHNYNIDDNEKLAESGLLDSESIADDHNSECIIRTVESYKLDSPETDRTNNTEDNIILVVQNEERPSVDDNVDSTSSLPSSDDEMVVIVNEKKARKKRDPMVYMTCSQCPVKYRFVAKLKSHMKTVHNMDLYYCKVCKIITEDKKEYEEHLKSHRNKHQCTVCNMVYKKADTLAAHMKLHDKGAPSEQLESGHMCEQCGAAVADAAGLARHAAGRHAARYTCYYCGRRYRVEGSFEAHVRKHEDYCARERGGESVEASGAPARGPGRRAACATCGKDFVDERALLWHQRLHSNERPFACHVCGRGFVSKNRRNQHALCAHTPPRRRCPLCPALFHLRSMVNTHVKKVHLKGHKRRARACKPRPVSWRTQPVPVPELSVAVQHGVLELQAAQADRLALVLPDPVRTRPTRSLYV